MNNFSFKELYDVSLKTTYPIEVGGRVIESQETIAVFDNIQISNFNEIKAMSSANGGYDNRSLVLWEESKEIRFSLIQGIFSKIQFALMAGARLIKNEGDNNSIAISRREVIETDDSGQATTKYPISSPIFVYNKNTGEKITNFTYSDNVIKLDKAYLEVVVDYCYQYQNKTETFIVGQQLIDGYLSLQGKTRVKDDTTGQVTTGIITIPKLKLMSNLSMRLGQDAAPQVGQLDAVAIPTGAKGKKKIMEIIFLEDDIDSDM